MSIINIICICVIALLASALFILAGIYRKFFSDNLESTTTDQDSGNGLVTPFKVSVADYIERTQLPIVEFTCNGKELLFILDSGSNGCHVNRSVVKELGVEITQEERKVGVENLVATGNGVAACTTEKCDLNLAIGEYELKVPLAVEDLDDAFNFMFKTDGVMVHGILGTNFLRANNWTIDFANGVAYPAFEVKEKEKEN